MTDEPIDPDWNTGDNEEFLRIAGEQMKKYGGAMELLKRFDKQELSYTELLKLGAGMCMTVIQEVPLPAPLSPVFFRLLGDLFLEEATAAKEHDNEDTRPENIAEGEYCRSEQFARAVAHSLLYPPVPYEDQAAQEEQYESDYQRLKVEDLMVGEYPTEEDGGSDGGAG
jgi:hypothetical protein